MKVIATTLVLCGLLALAKANAATTNTVDSALRRSAVLLTRAASNWQQHKTCFSCHHQTLPVLALTELARAGVHLEPAWLKSQTATTHKYFDDRIEDMDEGNHVPGGSTTAGYGLWALSMADASSDQTTTAIVTYLLKIQGVARLQGRAPTDLSRLPNGRWTTSCRRLPMQGSDVADTVLALIGMEKYATEGQRPQVAKAREAAEKWLVQTPLKTQEDRIWRLWGLHRLSGDATAKAAVRQAIVAAQREDGGWPQTDEQPSDAFSTGQTLFVLRQTGSPADDPVVLRARDYLLRTQLADGSWRVESRVKVKAQPYFENGDPHGEHQFLSTAATAWATAALAQFPASKDGSIKR